MEMSPIYWFFQNAMITKRHGRVFAAMRSAV